MGMLTHVVGIIPADEKYELMKTIWELCKKAGIEPPSEVSDFFDGEEPDGTGVIVTLNADCAEQWSTDDAWCIQVDVSKLPEHVRYVRFYNYR